MRFRVCAAKASGNDYGKGLTLNATACNINALAFIKEKIE
ncbi:hypothetical protein OKN36_05140 [Furfurilactobacillus sp. OKN36]